jgi:hypothetical protein
LNNNDYGEQISGMPYKLRKMKHIDIRDSEQFYKLLRLSLRLTQEFPVDVSAETWRRLYQTAVRQSLVGICYQGVCLLPEGSKPPVEIAMQWASEAESIRGLNELLYQEAAQLTRKFAEKGRRTAILKGQANARLYPDKYARQPGDIDIWAEGGRESVLALLPNHEKPSYHHVHLPANENGVVVEVHFRPSSGNFNPITNRRLQRWLEREILSASMVEEGFCVPSVRFALVMQLAHVQRHFLASGLGLRHVCDYYWLLQNSTAEDLRVVAGLLKEFGLHHAAGALMWVIGKVLHLDSSLMLCEADSYRGEWMLREIMAGGNFGWYAERQKHNVFRRVLEGRLRHLRLMPFDFWEMLWLELRFWKAVITTLPTRIRYRTLSLRDIPR